MKKSAIISGVILSVLSVQATLYTWETAENGNWTDLQWTPAGSYPDDAGDSASIAVTGSDYSVTLNANATVNTFDLSSINATFLNIFRTLYTTNAYFNSGKARLGGGTIYADNMGISSGFDFRVQGNVSLRERTAGGDLSISQAGDLSIVGSSGSATLTVSDGFLNQGTILLNSENAVNNAALLITEGTLVNDSGATISVDAGTGGARTLTTHLVNNGTVSLNADTSLNRSSGIFTNNAAFNIAAGKTMTLGGSGILRFTQAGGTLDNQGRFYDYLERFDFMGGDITGNPIEQYAGYLNIGPGAGAGHFLLESTVNYSGNILDQQRVDVKGRSTSATLTAANGFSNSGELVISSANAVYNSTLTVSSGALVNNADGELTVEPGTGGTRTLNTHLVNDGIVNLRADTTLSRTSGLYTNNAAFNIADGKTVTLSGSSPRFIQAGGTLDNQGRFYSAVERFDFMGGDITGNEIEIYAGYLNIGSAAGSGVFKLESTVNYSGDISDQQQLVCEGRSTQVTLSAANGFSNSGELVLSSTNGVYNASLSVLSGFFVNNADGELLIQPGSGGQRYLTSHLVNNGTVDINASTYLSRNSGLYTNNAAFNIVAGKTVTLSGSSPRFIQAGGILDNQGRFYSSTERFDFMGGDITGNEIEIYGGYLNIGPAAGSGVFKLESTVYYSGDIKTNHQIIAEGKNTPVTLSAASGFSNSGEITLTSVNTNIAYNASLVVTTGSFVNNTEGTLNVETGEGGLRYLTAHTVNDGTININADTTLSRSSGIYSNNAAFNIAAGKTVTLTGSSPRFIQTGGTLDNQGRFYSASERFDFIGGDVTGNEIESYGGYLNILPGSGSGAFALDSTVYYSGSIATNQSVRVRADTTHANLSAATGFSNSGNVILTSTNNVYNSTLTVISGSFVNNAEGLLCVEPGSGGARNLNAEFSNAGLFDISADLTVSRNNASHLNSGTISLTNGATLAVAGSGVITFSNSGTIAGNGTLDFSDPQATFNNEGTIAPGYSAGEITVVDDYNQGSSGTLEIEIGGDDPGVEFDRLVVTGDAVLDGFIGVVDLTETTGFLLSSGMVFTVFTATSVTDSGLALTPEASLNWGLIVNSDSVQVEYLGLPPYQLDVKTEGDGSVTPDGFFRFRDPTTYTFTNTPATYWYLGDVKLDGVSQGALPICSVTVSNTAIYTAVFEPETTERGTELWWLAEYGFTNSNEYENVENTDHDNDGYTTFEEFVADSNPLDSNSVFRASIVISNNRPTLPIKDLRNRFYSADYRTNLATGAWMPLYGGQEYPGSDGAIIDSNTTDSIRFYKLKVRLENE